MEGSLLTFSPPFQRSERLEAPKRGGNKQGHKNFIEKRPFLHNSVFIRNLGRVCSQFRLSFRNSVQGPFNTISRNPSLCWLGGGGSRGTKIVNKHFVNKLASPIHDILTDRNKTQHVTVTKHFAQKLRLSLRWSICCTPIWEFLSI